MTDSIPWGELPAAVRKAIEEHTGPVSGSSPGGEGMSSSLRLILDTAGGMVFIKGAGPGDDESRSWRLDLGAAMAPHVTAISPPLLFQARAGGWNVAGWPALPGRPWADQRPGSPDVPKMAGLLATLAGIPAPAVLTTTARECWGCYTADPEALDGAWLVHRDPNPTNFVVDGPRAWLVDWGWACSGPAWLTSAQLILSMMEAGWEAPRAEQALAGVPAWAAAPPRAVAAFAAANARSWDAAVERAPGEIRQFRAGIARQWAARRQGLR